MSTLTKIFVVLLVVLSLILSAGLIVFVNRQENFKIAAEDAKKQLMAAQNQTALVNTEIAKVQAQSAALAAELANQISALKGQIHAGEEEVAKRDATINDLQQNQVQSAASIASITQALQVAQKTIKAQDDNLGQIRTSDDKLQKQVVEDSNRITELTNSLEVTTKQSRFMGEQNTQLQQQLAVANEALHKYGISPTGTINPAGGAINTTPTININGVVREFKNINGVPYATISLGTADQVTRGMEFKVIDPAHNQFLGYLTVDNVQDHESTGHLTGPNVSQVRPNVSEVRTQL